MAEPRRRFSPNTSLWFAYDELVRMRAKNLCKWEENSNYRKRSKKEEIVAQLWQAEKFCKNIGRQ